MVKILKYRRFLSRLNIGLLVSSFLVFGGLRADEAKFFDALQKNATAPAAMQMESDVTIAVPCVTVNSLPVRAADGVVRVVSHQGALVMPSHHVVGLDLLCPQHTAGHIDHDEAACGRCRPNPLARLALRGLGASS